MGGEQSRAAESKTSDENIPAPSMDEFSSLPRPPPPTLALAVTQVAQLAQRNHQTCSAFSWILISGQQPAFATTEAVRCPCCKLLGSYIRSTCVSTGQLQVQPGQHLRWLGYEAGRSRCPLSISIHHLGFAAPTPLWARPTSATLRLWDAAKCQITTQLNRRRRPARSLLASALPRSHACWRYDASLSGVWLASPVARGEERGGGAGCSVCRVSHAVPAGRGSASAARGPVSNRICIALSQPGTHALAPGSSSATLGAAAGMPAQMPCAAASPSAAEPVDDGGRKLSGWNPDSQGSEELQHSPCHAMRHESRCDPP